MDRGFDIPWIGDSIYYGQGVQNTMGRRFDIPWIRCSIYHG
jgi:hypothetical protein